MSDPMFLTLNEVVERYRGQICEGTLRNWAFDEDRSAVHQDRQGRSLSMEELDRWDRRNLADLHDRSLWRKRRSDCA
jgi:hypothetical protein